MKLLGLALLLLSFSLQAAGPKATNKTVAAKAPVAKKAAPGTVDPCHPFKAKFCADKKTPFETTRCLVGKRADLPKVCKDKLYEQTNKENACATAILMYCPSATDTSVLTHLECLHKNHSSLSTGCQEALKARQENVKKTVGEFEAACSSEYKEFCPNLKDSDLGACMDKVYGQNKLQGQCKGVMDKYAAMRKKRPAPKGN